MKFSSLLTLSLCLSLLSSCGIEDRSLSLSDSVVMGEDDREAFDLRANPYYLKVLKMWTYYPWVNQENGGRSRKTSTCTGTLVGPDIVLTAAHCIESLTHEPNEIGYAKFFQDTFFFSGVTPEGGYLDKVKAVDAIVGAFDYSGFKNNSAEDWAFVRIEKPLGEKYGYFKMQHHELSQQELSQLSLRFVGFHGDLRGARMQKTCRAFATNPKGDVYTAYSALSYDCDMTRGSSGSAILACDETEEGSEPSCHIIAVNSGYTTWIWKVTNPATGESKETYRETINYGVPTSLFSERIKDFLN